VAFIKLCVSGSFRNQRNYKSEQFGIVKGKKIKGFLAWQLVFTYQCAIVD